MERFTSNDGTEVACWRSGTGPPLLLVHGTTADHSRWASISPRFEQHFTVLAMDRRGRGSSGDGPEYAVQREAEDIAAVVDAVGEAMGEPCSVLAHSYGAACSLEAAPLTDHIRRLVLYEPPLPAGLPTAPPGVAERIQTLVDQGDLEAALEVFMRKIVRMPEHELAVYRELPMWQRRIALAPTIAREMRLDQTYTFDRERFAQLQVPTLLLLGGDSPPLFQRAVELIDATLPNAQVVVMPGQQHVAMDTAPDLFMEKVLPFLLD